MSRASGWGRTAAEEHTDVPFRVKRRVAKPDRRRRRCCDARSAGHRCGQRRRPRFLPGQPHRMDRGRARWRNSGRRRNSFQPPSGPGPVTFDKAHPYIDNRVARRTGKQPTLRVADLSNPILQPWVREQLRKVNASRADRDRCMFTPKERCWPIGVPGFLLYPVTPVYFLQTPKEVVMIWEEDHMARHIYLTDEHSPEREAVLVRRIHRPLRERRYARRRYDRAEHQDLRRHYSARRTPNNSTWSSAFASSTAARRWKSTCMSRIPARSPRRGTRCSATGASQQGPMREQVCAENNDKFFGYDVDPIPQADKPDF